MSDTIRTLQIRNGVLKQKLEIARAKLKEKDRQLAALSKLPEVVSSYIAITNGKRRDEEAEKHLLKQMDLLCKLSEEVR